jgi:hypothetical protein
MPPFASEVANFCGAMWRTLSPSIVSPHILTMAQEDDFELWLGRIGDRGRGSGKRFATAFGRRRSLPADRGRLAVLASSTGAASAAVRAPGACCRAGRCTEGRRRGEWW